MRQEDNHNSSLSNTEIPNEIITSHALDCPQSTIAQTVNELYSLVGAGTACLSPFSEGGLHIAQGYLGIFLSVFVWNMLTIAAALSQAFYHSRHSKISALNANAESLLQVMNWIISVGILFLMTLPATITSFTKVIKIGFTNHFFSSSENLAPNIYFVVSDFAYGLSTMVNIVANIYHIMRACQKLSPDNIFKTWFLLMFIKCRQEFDFTALQNDRNVKLSTLNLKLEKINLTPEIRDALTKKQKRIALQLQNLTSPVNIEDDHDDVINIKCLFEQPLNENVRTYLYRKQRNKLFNHSLALLGNIFCVLGAVFGGISNFEGERNFLYPAAVFYVMQAMIKVYQELQKHLCKRNYFDLQQETVNKLLHNYPCLFSPNEISRLGIISSPLLET